VGFILLSIKYINAPADDIKQNSIILGMRSMSQIKLTIRATLCLLFMGWQTVSAEPDMLVAADLQKILPELQKGGYVIYFRHMSTEHSQEDQRPVDLNDCKSQRPLSSKGQQQADKVGSAFRRLKIPLESVTTSPFCRCKETARRAFGEFKVSMQLYFAMGLTREQKTVKGGQLRDMLSRPTSRGKNRIIVAHTANLQEATGYWPKPEGVAYIFKPQKDSEYQVIGKVEPETWVKLLK